MIKIKNKKVLTLASAILSSICLTACSSVYTISETLKYDTLQMDVQCFKQSTEKTHILNKAAGIIPSKLPVIENKKITLMAVGDNLMHMGIVRTGKMEDGSYDYSFMYEGLSDFLENADIKIINQETILGGNELGFSGFPAFNSPTEVGDAIAQAGFNVVLHASNHSADMGLKGLKNCLSFWQKYEDILVTGIYEEAIEEAGEGKKIPVLTIDGVDFAILNYTYGPNMETIPKSIQGHLDILCDWNRKTGRIDFTTLNPDVISDIEKAEEIADVVIVCPHWGTEYTTVPSSYQREFALQMTQAGADLIIGTHPHVVQPVEWIESENGNKALCYYSLGNYVSTQKNGISMLEAMAWVSFEEYQGEIRILDESTGVLPMVCHYTSGPVRLESVYFLENYTKEQVKQHGIRGYGGVNLKLEDLQKWSNEVFDGHVLSIEQVLERKDSNSEQADTGYKEQPIQ